MQYYLIALIISLVFSLLYVKDSEHKKIYFILSVLPMIFISGFRYHLGTDYDYRYVPDFKYMSRGYSPDNLEIGFQLIVRVILLFTKNPQYLFLVTSIFTLGILYLFMFKNTRYPCISILVFFLGGYFFNSMNILRQYIAMSLLICAACCLLKDKIYLWLLFIGLAMTQHTTSFIFLLSYIPYYYKYDLIKIGKILTIFLSVGIAGKPMLMWLISLTRFKVYLKGSFAVHLQGDFQFTQTVVCLLIAGIYLAAYYFIPKMRQDKEMTFYISMQLIALVFSIYTAFMFISTRFVVFFSIFTIFGIAKLYEYLKESHLYKHLSFALLVIYIGSFTYIYLIHKVDEVLPYQYNFDLSYVELYQEEIDYELPILYSLT